MNEDQTIPPGAAPVIPRALPTARPVVLGYRNPRDESARRHRLRARRRERRRRRRPSKAGVTGLAASGLLVLLSLGTLLSALASNSGRAAGPASLACTTLPLTYVAVMCGVIGVIPRGKSTFHGWCALAVTAASWGVYAAAYMIASHG